jgi:phage protein D
MSLDAVEQGAITPSISWGPGGAMPLTPLVAAKLIRTVVDTSLLRPDMFELTFVDREGVVVEESMLDIGTEVTISIGSGPMATDLIVGEVTSIEGDYDGMVHSTIIRGYEHAHRLQRARRSRTFLDSTDGEIAERIASEADLSIGTIEDPGVTHAYIGQVAQTDWEFLRGRAREIGYETGVVDGEFFFRRAPGMSAGGLGGAAGAVGGAVADAAGLGTPTLRFGDNLRWIRPRISSGGLMSETEVRVWDPASVQVVSGRATLASSTASVDADPVQLANSFGGPLRLPALPSIPFLPSFLAASGDAYAVVDRPLASGGNAQSAADAVAAGMAEHVASTFAEAEGMCIQTPGVRPGSTVTLENVPQRFAADWYVTSARHEFAIDVGFRTRFEVSGRHDRSLHGLVTGGTLNRRQRGLIDGLVPGLVTDNIDEDGMYRVKVALPWLSPDFVTDWARVVLPGLGAAHGIVMLPEIGDEVLVGFEFGDVRRAYVLGGLGNGETGVELGGDPVKQGIPGGQVVKRGIVSRLGHKILIDDDGDGTTPPIVSGITIGNADDTITIQYDDVAKKLTILCDASTPPAAIEIRQQGAGGSISIEQAGVGGTLEITSAGNVTVEAAAPGNLTLKGGAGVKIDGGAGMVELSGSMVKLN